MRPPLLALATGLLVALAAGCQDPVPQAPTPTPTPAATPTGALTPPPNFFVQPGRIYTYRRTRQGGDAEIVKVEIGGIEGETYHVTVSTATGQTASRQAQAFGVFPFGLSPAGVPDRAIDDFPRETVHVPAGAMPVRRVAHEGATYDFSEDYGILVRAVTTQEGVTTTTELVSAEPTRYRL